MSKVVVLVMSVGLYENNATAKYLKRIGAKYNDVCICLPKASEEHIKSYDGLFETFIYDEKKYIDDSFEWFGFRPRNCGGVGRQGIAECVETLGDFIFFQLDDDTAGICVSKMVDGKLKSRQIKRFQDLCELVETLDGFYRQTKVECSGKTGATIPKDGFISNNKIFNNFIMRKGCDFNFFGFKAITSDDYRYNLCRNLINKTPMIACKYMTITFAQSQGDRSDGNAPMYNKDCAWRKSYVLKMMAPWAVEQHIAVEKNRVQYRENLEPSKIFPPICVVDKTGEIVGRLK